MASPAKGVRRRVTLERTLRAGIEEVWELWTTREGIESWWGPEGFSVRVRALDLRPGGELLYTMSATAPEQVEFMKKAGMPVSVEHRLRYTDVVPQRRLAYLIQADFIPGVKPYEVATTIEFEQQPEGVRLVLTFDAMHDENWTERSVRGRASELDRLEARLRA